MQQRLSPQIYAANTQIIANGHLHLVSDFFSEDYVVHLTAQDVSGGHKMIRNALGVLRSAFPDIGIEVAILVEREDRVAWQRTLKGTQLGAYKGFPASGRTIEWRDMVTSRFRNGLIVEEWVVTDLAERLLLSRKR